ncbi:malto-oligosyltrehalose synthase [Salinimicrobium marinum]|uniref:Malto-oligosyltrehalose synthase n=1 Tax=Salinimicrobium marinum TaxID=680283 RepID=A0A918VX83_9FLAO|nr:malto-oligosyltrehalose synthase [Salinimicrobium marinum]GHA31841.1 malto-oligosyltrehalose synthase [Salinimicrobium marinum]
MRSPSSTYRIQLSPDFPLEELWKIVDYLEVLGISTIYSAPFFQAREGSTHGYDITDPYKINREIGTLENFRLLSELLKEKKMTWLQDIVPNHMAFDGTNPWLRDIFELGPDSKYYNFFDIDWDYKGWGKIMSPFLGNPLEEVLESNDLKLNFDREGFSLNYFDHSYPLSVRSYSKILEKTGINGWKEKFSSFSGNDMQWKDLKTGFYREAKDTPQLESKVREAIRGIRNSKESMQEILELQYFKPCHWKETEQEINYRRFFTINDLICLRMEDPEVFKTYHHYILELCESGLIDGLRIDHIDGLLDPAAYTKMLRKALGDNFYVIVEKILEWDENLPLDWPVQGTSGYDFLAEVNQLFTKADNKEKFTEAYEKIIPRLPEYEDLVYDKKLFILKKRMGGELHNLWLMLKDNQLLPEEEQDEEKWKKVLGIFLAGFPVYRIYPEKFPLDELQKKTIEQAFQHAVNFKKEYRQDLEVLKKIFLGEAEKDQEKMFRFLHRCQQFTGPLAAKGVEDTSFYIFNRLVSHNEVGDSPENFGLSIEGFHQKMQQRKKDFPLSVNATATHDTKRGEDARMRLNVLSEIPEEWFTKVEEWNKITQNLRKEDSGPGPNETYFIYQTLLGGMPFDQNADEEFLTRTKDYLQKVLREAKVHSNWADPDEEYESAVFEFTEAILNDDAFRKSFDPFQKKIALLGAVKSLGQTLLKVTVPGVPDIYQGTEFWDLSYVDPDNRRPVDYDLRKRYITDFKSYNKDDLNKEISSFTTSFSNAKIKMYSLFKALNLRRKNEKLFEKGEYLPLEISGKASENFIAFARKMDQKWCVVVVPVLVNSVFEAEGKLIPKPEELEGSYLQLPAEAPKKWLNEFTQGQISTEGKVELNTLCSEFPMALLKNNTE